MVKRRKEEDIAGILEFDGRGAEDPEFQEWLADHKARIQANNDAIAKEKERFFAWRLKKQEEEQKIADSVSYFVTENPITGAHAAPPVPAPKPE